MHLGMKLHRARLRTRELRAAGPTVSTRRSGVLQTLRNSLHAQVPAEVRDDTAIPCGPCPWSFDGMFKLLRQLLTDSPQLSGP
jgi:hypothetical protein